MRLACRLPIAPSSCPLQAAFPSAYSARWTISNASAWIFDARPFCRVISATVAATRAELAWCVAHLASAAGGDVPTARRAVLTAAGGHVDSVVTQAAVIIHEGAKRRSRAGRNPAQRQTLTDPGDDAA